ncbi:hypothetical protein ABPG75_004995 [Micractinium tetrahymenae]
MQLKKALATFAALPDQLAVILALALAFSLRLLASSRFAAGWTVALPVKTEAPAIVPAAPFAFLLLLLCVCAQLLRKFAAAFAAWHEVMGHRWRRWRQTPDWPDAGSTPGSGPPGGSSADEQAKEAADALRALPAELRGHLLAAAGLGLLLRVSARHLADVTASLASLPDVPIRFWPALFLLLLVRRAYRMVDHLLVAGCAACTVLRHKRWQRQQQQQQEQQPEEQQQQGQGRVLSKP